MESKREKFVRLAETRTNKLIEMLRLLGNCSNRANYEYTEEDVRRIFAILEQELQSAKSRFTGTPSGHEKFTLEK